jgi:hypothetical protein
MSKLIVNVFNLIEEMKDENESENGKKGKSVLSHFKDGATAMGIGGLTAGGAGALIGASNAFNLSRSAIAKYLEKSDLSDLMDPLKMAGNEFMHAAPQGAAIGLAAYGGKKLYDHLKKKREDD